MAQTSNLSTNIAQRLERPCITASGTVSTSDEVTGENHTATVSTGMCEIQGYEPPTRLWRSMAEVESVREAE